MEIELVSLGGWCRPAYQLRNYAAKNEGISCDSYPFDWTITPYLALMRCLSSDFATEEVLPEGKIIASFAGSGMCASTGLIFHHALDRARIEEISKLHPGDPLPEDPDLQVLVRTAKQRFTHTYSKLRMLRATSKKIVFCRWQRYGHPDHELSTAFEGESIHRIREALSNLLQRNDFTMLSVTTRQLPAVRKVIKEPILEIGRTGNIYTAHLAERRGWNGNQESSFKGDEPSWERLLNYVTSEIRAA